MDDKQKAAVEEYQCPGCMGGFDISCFDGGGNRACDKHSSGTLVLGIGKIFLGLPVGFNRLGPSEDMKVNIFNSLNDGWGFDIFNVPVWKYLDKHGNTLVRGLSPRTNQPFIHIFLEDCMEHINCASITDTEIGNMD